MYAALKSLAALQGCPSMHRVSLFVRGLWLHVLLCAALLFSLGARDARCQLAPPKTVLVLNSYRSGYAWTDDEVRGVRSVLSNQPYPVELYVEYMDASRCPGQQHLDSLQAFYRSKYGGRSIDLILSTD